MNKQLSRVLTIFAILLLLIIIGSTALITQQQSSSGHSLLTFANQLDSLVNSVNSTSKNYELRKSIKVNEQYKKDQPIKPILTVQNFNYKTLIQPQLAKEELLELGAIEHPLNAELVYFATSQEIINTEDKPQIINTIYELNKKTNKTRTIFKKTYPDSSESKIQQLDPTILPVFNILGMTVNQDGKEKLIILAKDKTDKPVGECIEPLLSNFNPQDGPTTRVLLSLDISNTEILEPFTLTSDIITKAKYQERVCENK